MHLETAKWGVVLTLLTLAAGCGEPSASPGGPDGAVTADGGATKVVPVERFVSEVAQATCEHLFRCCKPAELSALGVPTKDECLKLFGAAGAIVGDLAKAVKAGRVEYDGAKAAACVAEVAVEACGASGSDPMAGHASCEAAIKGKTAAGSVCETGWECGGGAICVSSGDVGDPGVCVARAKAGDPCEVTFDCGEALRCDETGKCAAKNATGGTCAFGDECVSGVCASGTCASATSCTGA
jgi:hypothetical protein